MAKLDALKEKISQAQNSVNEKLDKIALFKNWKEKRAQKTKDGPPSYSIQNIYRQGNTGTRIQVILVYLFAFSALFFTFQAGRKFFSRLGKSVENEKLKTEYSHGLGDLAQRVVERANMVSMGKFTTNGYQEGKPGSYIVVDIWLRVSEPTAAEYAQKHETIIYDGIVNALNEAYQEKIDALSNEGNEAMKKKVADTVNKLLPHGQVEEVFFQNLVLQ